MEPGIWYDDHDTPPPKLTKAALDELATAMDAMSDDELIGPVGTGYHPPESKAAAAAHIFNPLIREVEEGP